MVLTKRFICSFISKRSAGAVFFRRILTHFSELQVTVFVYRVSILDITRMSGYIFKLTSFRRLKNVHEKSVLWDGRHFEKHQTRILVHFLIQSLMLLQISIWAQCSVSISTWYEFLTLFFHILKNYFICLYLYCTYWVLKLVVSAFKSIVLKNL